MSLIAQVHSMHNELNRTEPNRIEQIPSSTHWKDGWSHAARLLDIVVCVVLSLWLEIVWFHRVSVRIQHVKALFGAKHRFIELLLAALMLFIV